MLLSIMLSIIVSNFHALTNPFTFWFMMLLTFSGTLCFGGAGSEVGLGEVAGGAGGGGWDGDQYHCERKLSGVGGDWVAE